MRLYLDANAIVFTVEGPDLQKDFSPRTIDALHVATAIRARADVFLTRDGGIARYATIRTVRIERIA